MKMVADIYIMINFYTPLFCLRLNDSFNFFSIVSMKHRVLTNGVLGFQNQMYRLSSWNRPFSLRITFPQRITKKLMYFLLKKRLLSYGFHLSFPNFHSKCDTFKFTVDAGKRLLEKLRTQFPKRNLCIFADNLFDVWIYEGTKAIFWIHRFRWVYTSISLVK